MHKAVDCDAGDIDWGGQVGNRGLRGLAFDSEAVYVAASNRLLAYSPDFQLLGVWESPFLKHCHSIAIWNRMLYLVSSAYDSILGFNLDEQRFAWAMNVQSSRSRFKPSFYNPMSSDGPLMLEKLNLTSIHCNQHGMYLSGLRTGGMLHFNGSDINMAVELPKGSYDARPFRDGVLFNDSEAGALRYTGRGEGEEDRAMHAPEVDSDSIADSENEEMVDGYTKFARGLCAISDHLVVGRFVAVDAFNLRSGSQQASGIRQTHDGCT